MVIDMIDLLIGWLRIDIESNPYNMPYSKNNGVNFPLSLGLWKLFHG